MWMDSLPERLSRTAREAITDTANSRHLSVASIWEMQIKLQLNKLSLRKPLAEILREQQARNLLQIAPIEVADVLALGTLPHLHRDPFDRLLVAQARRGGFHLVGNDPEIAGYDVPILW